MLFSYSPEGFLHFLYSCSEGYLVSRCYFPAVQSSVALLDAVLQYVLIAFILLYLLVIFLTSAFVYNNSLSVLLSPILCIHTFQGNINMRTISMLTLTIFLTMLARRLIFKLTFLGLGGGIVPQHTDIYYEPCNITL